MKIANYYIKGNFDVQKYLRDIWLAKGLLYKLGSGFIYFIQRLGHEKHRVYAYFTYSYRHMEPSLSMSMK